MTALRRAAHAALVITLMFIGSIGAAPALADGAGKVRVGVLKFGTVNWALDVIKEKGLDKAEGVELEVVELANKDATNVALQGGAVDMIVTDWIWVSRLRAEGRDYTFAPYSLAVGSVMVRPDAGISTVADLKGKRLGVAGGPVDKSWLLLRAYTQKTLGEDIATMLKPNFAAPPLLNELIMQGELDAVLNFWHFSSRLEAAGMQKLIGVSEILPALGVNDNLPLLGWVFSDSWAQENRPTVEAFLRAAQKAQQLMKEDDALWNDYLRPKTKAEDDATLVALRDNYRAGIPQHFGAADIAIAQQVFEIMAKLGGEELIGASATLTDGTFWSGYTF
jgi:NitT/TauT family transport system substrate-binding protein